MKKKYKFKIGDKVKIKEGIKVGRDYNGALFVSEMEIYIGKVLTIDKIDTLDETYLIKEDKNHWYWTSDMLIPVSHLKITVVDGDEYV